MKSFKLTLITPGGARIFYIEDVEGEALIRPRGVVRSLAGRDVALRDGYTGEVGITAFGLKVEIDE